MSLTVIVQNDIQASIPELKDFKTWADTAISYTKKPHLSELCIRIISKEESAHLNETFRHKTGPTNVLAFPYEDHAMEPIEACGDLAICAELVAEEAAEQHKSVQAHYAHLTIHGTLHLLGFDHIDDADAQIMEALEIKILNNLGFANPYEEEQKLHDQ